MKNKKLIITIAIFAVIIGGLIAWYFLFYKKKPEVISAEIAAYSPEDETAFNNILIAMQKDEYFKDGKNMSWVLNLVKKEYADPILNPSGTKSGSLIGVLSRAVYNPNNMSEGRTETVWAEIWDIYNNFNDTIALQNASNW